MRDHFPRHLHRRHALADSVFSAAKRKHSCRAPACRWRIVGWCSSSVHGGAPSETRTAPSSRHPRAPLSNVLATWWGSWRVPFRLCNLSSCTGCGSYPVPRAQLPESLLSTPIGLIAQTFIPSPCSDSASRVQSATLAAVATTE